MITNRNHESWTVPDRQKPPAAKLKRIGPESQFKPIRVKPETPKAIIHIPVKRFSEITPAERKKRQQKRRSQKTVWTPEMIDRCKKMLDEGLSATEIGERIGNLSLQGRSMTEQEKEAFLDSFREDPDSTHVGFCVMGGLFAEGIDLKNDRLIGVVVVGTGLPMVCDERELFRNYFDDKNDLGFEYAYLYNGMNKVMQAAGRVIRTMEDTGAILLLDERFLNRQYLELFPREWSDYRTVTYNSINKELEDFWNIH